MESNKFENLEKAGPVILRFGLAIVFLWFGFSQLANPTQWTSFLPSFISIAPISAVKFVLLNGWFEIVGAVLLILGTYTRPVALLLALHLFGITFTIGWNALGIRDFGLSIATLVIFLQGAGGFSVDNFKERTSTGLSQ
ncbi:MAG: DoxX family protein [Candidatus Paceibacterota bacterium]|jgi:uncharacterized membrane protein YphA (DoxX/SURF4 family)